MSRINRVRLINLTYNHGSIVINDETFDFNGESTLISLRNGGGKSVFVQMLMAPFMHKRYRDLGDRKFEGYFNSSRPSFILVEWLLDGGKNYMTNGFMIRKSQYVREDNDEPLEIISIISEYLYSEALNVEHSIQNLPLVSKTRKTQTLKSFQNCRQLFEEYKKDPEKKFSYYDMNSPAQQRQYFERLKDYGIDYKEWETVIRRVNEKEHGLDTFLNDCRDEKGLLEKQLIPTAETKLDGEGLRMREFRRIIDKHARQCYENDDKIKRQENIRKFLKRLKPSDDPMEQDNVYESAVKFKCAEHEKRKQESRIAGFSREIGRLLDEAEKREDGLERDIKSENAAKIRVKYEKFSREIRRIMAETKESEMSIMLFKRELEDLNRQISEAERGMNILECARLYEDFSEARREFERVRAALSVASMKEEEQRPRKDELGRAIFAFYNHEKSEALQSLNETEKEEESLEARLIEIERELDETDLALNDLSKKEGRLIASIAGFDKEEARYNEEFSANLSRNILKRYEDGTLEIEEEKHVKSLAETKAALKHSKISLSDCETKAKSLIDKETRLKIERSDTENAIKAGKDAISGLKDEIEFTKNFLTMLRMDPGKALDINDLYGYLGEAPGENLFKRDLILERAGSRIEELEISMMGFNNSIRSLKAESEALKSGRIFDLPTNIAAWLKELGISAATGAEWLLKNGMEKAANLALVRKNPFLPYSVIMQPHELEAIKNARNKPFTSFPVPIILRGDLERGIFDNEISNEGLCLLDLGVLKIFVNFNENFLDPALMQEMLEDRLSKIRENERRLALVKEERQAYIEKREIFRGQSLTRELLEESLKRLESLDRRYGELCEEISLTEKEEAENAEKLRGLRADIERLSEKSKWIEKAMAGLKRFKESYEKYLDWLRQESAVAESIKNMEGRKKLFKSSEGKTRKKIKDLAHERELKTQRIKELSEKCNDFKSYESAEKSGFDGLSEGLIDRCEAEYEELKRKYFGEVEKLKEDLARSTDKLERSEKALKKRKEKYSISDSDLDGGFYDEEKEAALSALKDEAQAKAERKRQDYIKEEKRLSALEQEIKGRAQRLKEEMGEDEPLPESEIRDIDFDSELKRLSFRIEELSGQRRVEETRIASFKSIISGLAEFEGLPAAENLAWDRDFSIMDERELNDYKGVMLRKLKGFTGEAASCREGLFGALIDMMSASEFQEDYFKKPIESIRRTAEDPEEALRQIAVTAASFEAQREKLEVDLAFIAPEREAIIAELCDFVKKLCLEIGKIDMNSTITLRDRPVKMLSIILPRSAGEMQDGDTDALGLRLKEYLWQVIDKAIDDYRKNIVAAEGIGTKINSRALFDTAIGLENVQIQLMKIEETREYAISWREVARNSGGEGFLSTFVILSSLLSYIRRDENDFFAYSHQGKVLPMDNPFGITYSEHLLKPMMDLAKKNDTQMICLSGLGGDSIYGRFDNIYVLNLVKSGLKSGTSYLKGERVKGVKGDRVSLDQAFVPETLEPSQVEVLEQESFVF